MGMTGPQCDAVRHVDGPLLVLAGPGSGKTRVITHRVAYLISQGVAPWHILAITFTNKAAAEMRERIEAMGLPGGTTVCTFHALAVRLLREFAEEAGLDRNFSIYDDSDQKAAMRQALEAAELDSKSNPPGRLLARISGYKNNLQTADQVAEQAGDFFNKTIAKAYRAYQAHLDKNNAVDFDDLLMKLALLLRDHPEIRERLNDRYRYVLVDEYQDTNQCQYQIARGLSLSHSNLCVTGDPDQSIYSWRGADIGNILAFEEDYPNATVVRLEENFRSTPEILKIADELIQGNSERKEKRLFTSKESGPPPQLVEFDSEYKEALGVATWIRQLRESGREYRDIAVFYRVNSMSRVLEEAMRRLGVPYQIVRGVEFFQRKEIKDMVAYLRFLANPSDQVSLRRIINTPTRGIGATTVERLFAESAMSGRDISEVLSGIEGLQSLGAAAKIKIKKFMELIAQLRGNLEGPVEDIVRMVFEETDYAKHLGKERSEDPLQNVEELINSAARYDEEAEEPSLVDYLQQIALVSDSDAYDSEAGCVSLMTLHAAKGLEFPVAVIVGVENGLIPHSRVGDSDRDLEEERRLLFVGITRAKQQLLLSYARNRTINGMSMATIRSPFVREMPSVIDESFAGYRDKDLATNNDSDDDWDDDPYAYDDDPYTMFRAGQLVRHPKLGVGRIQEVISLRENSKVVVQFTTGGRKTLVLKYANLEKLDYAD